MRHIILAIAILICTAADAQIIRADPFYTAPEEAAVVTNLLLDSFPGAAVAYSLRKLDKDYTGSAIRVRRSSDNTEQDIGFVNNYLDTASMKTFVGANNGFVVTWYNQADSAGVFGVKNVTNSVAANQPQIVTSGAVNYQDGEVCITFDGSNDFLQVNYSPPIYNLTIINVQKFNTTGNNQLALMYSDPPPARDSTQLYFGLNLTDASTRYSYGAFQQKTRTRSTNRALVELYVDGANGGSWYFNAATTGFTPNATVAGINKPNGRALTIGAYYLGTFAFNGMHQEVILYELFKGNDRTAIENNINSFYSIY